MNLNPYNITNFLHSTGAFHIFAFCWGAWFNFPSKFTSSSSSVTTRNIWVISSGRESPTHWHQAYILAPFNLSRLLPFFFVPASFILILNTLSFPYRSLSFFASFFKTSTKLQCCFNLRSGQHHSSHPPQVICCRKYFCHICIGTTYDRPIASICYRRRHGVYK